MSQKTLLISACLLGEPCRYDGKSKICGGAELLRACYHLIPVCPERDGGLPTPRPPCELQNGRAVNIYGQDCTSFYEAGARFALRCAQENNCTMALLKEKSPSCGHGQIYDGTFSKTLTKGDGITAALLMQNGIRVFGEHDIPFLTDGYQKEDP